MKIHRGRLVDHIHARTRDLDAAKRFYRAVLQSVGPDDAIHEYDKGWKT